MVISGKIFNFDVILPFVALFEPKTKEFKIFRGKAMKKRKERYMQKNNDQVTTISEISAKLKDTP
jgi:hypothetical protein